MQGEAGLGAGGRGLNRLDLRAVITSEERTKVYAFRYRIYVEEMRRPEPWADHLAQTIEEPFDVSGTVFAAMDGAGTVIGTARVNLARDTVLGEYEAWYRMRALAPSHPTESAIVTKLMVDSRFRGSRIAVRLATACFDFGIREGIRFCFIDCNEHLRGFFSRLGFRQVAPDFEHPVYGLVHPMVLALHDRAHLLGVASPFRGESIDRHPPVDAVSRLSRDDTPRRFVRHRPGREALP